MYIYIQILEIKNNLINMYKIKFFLQNFKEKECILLNNISYKYIIYPKLIVIYSTYIVTY